jgi:hypothetical protein
VERRRPEEVLPSDLGALLKQHFGDCGGSLANRRIPEEREVVGTALVNPERIFLEQRRDLPRRAATWRAVPDGPAGVGNRSQSRASAASRRSGAWPRSRRRAATSR